jgi:long-chain fatty acid transport protein
MKLAHKSAVSFFSLLLLCSLTLVPAAHATNGMNMEGYGPIATGMGGASFAYDNGTAAVMNNPATLSLMESKARLDLAIGFLAPDITASMAGMPDAKSSADLFTMPAFGYVRKAGDAVYGVGVFAQGGMGAEYDANSFLAMGSGDKVRSELGVGRLIIPFSYNVNKDLAIAVSLDYVWATLDLKMAASVSALGNMLTSCTGPLCGIGALPATNWARIDFSGGGDMNGAARGTGFAGKIGAVYKINPAFTIGATYHSKTALSDLETDSEGATISAQGIPGAAPGKITVRDFQWPATYGVGVAWSANKQLLVAADVKVIGWKDVMKDFKMTFDGSGSTINFAMPQNWKDQTVFELGVAYLFTPEFTGRIGVNLASNPIPNDFVNPLFPAIIENHYTIGAGYAISKNSSIDFSLAYAPEVKVTTSVDTGAGFVPLTITHSQMNEQIMYSYRF